MTTGNSRFTLFQYEEWRNETEANRKYETYFPWVYKPFDKLKKYARCLGRPWQTIFELGFSNLPVLTLEAASGPGDRKCPQNPTVLGPWETISGIFRTFLAFLAPRMYLP